MSRDQPGVTADRCPPARPQVLREYALLADGERGALVDPHGEIAWLCAPRWDSQAVFSALLGGPGALPRATCRFFRVGEPVTATGYSALTGARPGNDRPPETTDDRRGGNRWHRPSW